MRSVFVRRLGATAALSALAWGGVWLASELHRRGLEWADKFSSVASFVVAAAVLVVSWRGVTRTWLRGAVTLSDVNITQAGDDLAAVLRAQRVNEERLHRINDPGPMPVRWATEAGEEGGLVDIRAAFDAAPAHRLVILGRAGSGKTVLAGRLVRDLLATRRSGDPVPVIVPIGAWQAGVPLDEWLADQLIGINPGLATRVRVPGGGVSTQAQILVASGGVLPVLDGLDELPGSVRADALDAVHAFGSDEPLVVTSRSREYQDAVAEAGRGVSRATVVELHPLRVAEVKAYLGEADARRAGRWRVVFERLDVDADGPLARVLTNPLMLWLARCVYADRRSDPGALADLALLPDQESVERHLLDGLIPALYANTDRQRRLGWLRYRRPQAQRWLAYLASYLDQAGTRDLAWWRLGSAGRGWPALFAVVRITLYAAVAWAASVAVLLWMRSTGIWYVRDMRIGLFDSFLLNGPFGNLLKPHLEQSLDALDEGWDFSGQDVFDVRTFAVAVGLAALIVAAFAVPAADSAPEASPRALRWRRPGLLRLAGAVVAGVALLTAVVLGVSRSASDFPPVPLGFLVVVGIFLPTVVSLPSWLSVPVDVSRATSPATVLRTDIRAHVVVTVLRRALFGALVWLFAGYYVMVGYGAYAILVTLLGLFLGGWGPTANQPYAEARLRLALARRLPWRTMRFLMDAHRRGVLRQFGAVYQFRHIRLQEHLAGSRRASRLELALTSLVRLVERGRPAATGAVLPPAQPLPWAAVRFRDPELAERLNGRRQETDATDGPPGERAENAEPPGGQRTQIRWTSQPGWPRRWQLPILPGDILGRQLRLHPLNLARRAGPAAVAVLITPFLVVYLAAQEAASIMINASIAGVIFTGAALVIGVLRWRWERLALTTRRLMAVSGDGTTCLLVQLDQVTDVYYEQSALGRLCGYGTLVVSTTAGHPPTAVSRSTFGSDGTIRQIPTQSVATMPYVPDPARMYNSIVANMTALTDAAHLPTQS